MKKYLLLSCLIGFLSSCNVPSQLQEMHDATQDVDQQSKELGKTSTEISKTSKDLSVKTDLMKQTLEGVSQKTTGLQDQTGELYDAIRQKDALVLRHEAWKLVLNSKSVAARLSKSAEYFMAFEFQLWSGLGQDNLAKRDLLAASAFREFFKDVQELFQNTLTLPNPLAKDNEGQALNTIAAAMSILNPKQEILNSANKDMKPYSIYSLIENSLKYKKDIQAGRLNVDQLPPYVKEVLIQENIAVYLLEVRMNFLAFMTAGKLLEKQNTSNHFFAKHWIEIELAALEKCVVPKFLLKLKPNVSEMNDSQIREISRYINGANKTRQLLASLGYPVRVQCVVKSLYQALSDTPIQKNGVVETPARSSLLSQLDEMVKDFNQGIQSRSP